MNGILLGISKWNSWYNPAGDISMTLQRLLWVGILCVPVQAATLRLDARNIFDRAVARDISLSADGSALQLNSGELFEDDGPAAGVGTTGQARSWPVAGIDHQSCGG
jgi:hypothetical protein